MISSASSGFSDAGNIRIGAQDIDLRHNSAITTSVAQGGGHGGNIHIGGEINDHGDIIESADRLHLNASRITASTDGGDGGNIAIGARQVVLDQGSMMSANTSSGVSGNVTIAGTVDADGQPLSRADTVVVRDSLITANAQAGQGGRIDIVAQAVITEPETVFDASAQAGGIDGEVNVEAIVTNLSGVVRPLSQRLASERLLLRNDCAARLHQGVVSSFVERERAGISSAPDDLLPSRLDSDWAVSVSSGDVLPQGIAMAEAPAWLLRSRCP